MVKVLGVIGARLNSSRLPGKQLLDLAGQPMIARIFQRLERIPELDHIVLATTADEYNQALVDWANTANKTVFAFDGDVNDLMGRINAIVEYNKPEIIVYFCGDSPLIEPSTVSIMIGALLTSPQADYVSIQSSTVGKKPIHEGFYPYRYKVWRRMVEEAQTASEREHVGLSTQHFIDELHKVYINDDPIFSQIEHRISVDTPSDYRFMNEVYQRWYAENNVDTVVSLPWVIEQLSQDVQLQTINAHVRQKGASDQSINVLIVTQCGQAIGLGHLTRMLVLARTLQDTTSAGVRILIQGDVLSLPGLNLLPHRFISSAENLEAAVEQEMQIKVADALVFDIAPAWMPKELGRLFEHLKNKRSILVAVDGLFEWQNQLDFIHVASFYLTQQYRQLVERGKASFGWENYLLQPTTNNTWTEGNKLLVLTGGSDVHQLGKVWPQLLDERLPHDAEVHWVQGPFSEAPVIPTQPRLNWSCHQSPEHLQDLMNNTSYALTLHGVSLFELLLRNIPTVLLAPNLTPNSRHNEEMNLLSDEQVAIIAGSPNAAIEYIENLMRDSATAQRLSDTAKAKIGDTNGALLLAGKVVQLVRKAKS